MTPARFDLLYALHGTYSRQWRVMMGGKLTQSELRRQLGLSKATVSIMLARLEELGLVRREKALRDKRHKLVLLTAEGRRRIRSAFDVVFNRGVVRRKLQRLFRPRGRATTRVRYAIYSIFESVRMIAEHFDCTAGLLYETAFPEHDD